VQFDKEKYKEFLTKHSREGTDPVDLLERYAVTLSGSTSDAEVKEQLTAVRAYWNQTANGNSRAAKKADWCRKQDTGLKAQHGEKLDSVGWWREKARAEADKSQAAIEALAQALKQAYGQLGVVTADDLARDGARNKLPAEQAAQAARLAGLPVIDKKTALPDQPLSSTAFKDLQKDLNDCQVATIAELLHPGSGPFRIVAGYECIKNPALRLDVAAINERITEAGKAMNPVNDAKLAALRKLSDAVKRKVEPQAVALYHLMELVADTQPVMAKQELQKAGVEERDAATIAALLQGRQKASRVSRLDQVLTHLADGQLAEAASLTSSLPDGDEKTEASKQVTAKQQELATLLAQAEAARQQADEAQAERLLQAARLISQADADDLLRRLPLAPPGPVDATGDGASVKLFWQRGPGHDGSTRYAVARAEGRGPRAPGDGALVYTGTETTCADSDAPAAADVQYGVFATAEGRPPSRPVVISVRPLPPVWDFKAETGVGSVSLHWQAKPAAQVRLTRIAPVNEQVRLPPGSSSVQLRDLPDGIAQVFEAVAVYRGHDGSEILSHPATVTAVPRGEAKPNDTLRVSATMTAGRTRVRASWKQIDSSKVSLLVTSREQPWPFRSVISPEEMTRGGTVLTGHVDASGPDRTLEVELPGGLHYLTPLSEGGTGVAVGRSRSVAVIDPVTNLTATVFAERATIAWHWPSSVQLAEVSWKPTGDSEDERQSFVISSAEYRSNGGAHVPLGARPIDVEVRAVVTANGKRYPSAPAAASVARVVKVPIRYRVNKLGPFGRGRKLAFTVDQPCSGTAVRLIAVPGPVMPTKPNEGVVVFETTLSLVPGVPAEHRLELPKTIKKPYWVRCFVMSGPGRLIDPPVGDLKED
jgi:hypothetical protein